MKILKEKVVEDEKKSGIGSLFDDEKSSFQHISLLKQKYQKMRRDFDRRIEELNKHKLNVIGEQFVLDSQINIMLAQNAKLEDQQKDYNGVISKRHFELDRELKDISKQRIDVENDLRGLDNEYNRDAAENYDSKMIQEKEEEFDKLDKERFELDVLLQEDLINLKKQQKLEFEAELEKVHQQFLSNAELQNGIAEEKRLKLQIDEAAIKLEML